MIKRIFFASALTLVVAYTWAQQSVSVDKIRQHIEVLASDSLAGRRTNTEGGLKATRYIREELVKSGMSAIVDQVNYINCNEQASQLTNIYCAFEGNDPKLKDEWIVLTAHYDHIGVDQNGQVYPGANDNATSVAALLEIVRNYKGMGRSLLVLFTDSEELGLDGSRAFIEHPPIELSSIKLVVVSEMLGHLNKTQEVQLLGKDMFEEGEQLIRGVEFEGLKVVDDDPNQRMYWNSSDCLMFWSQGIPILIYYTPTMENLHAVSDTASSIDMDGVALITEYMIENLQHLGNAPTITPTDLAKEIVNKNKTK